MPPPFFVGDFCIIDRNRIPIMDTDKPSESNLQHRISRREFLKYGPSLFAAGYKLVV